MIKKVLQSQYDKCFHIFQETIKNYDKEIWFDEKNYKTPAWQITYHAIFYANIYCSPTEKDIVHWQKEIKHYRDFKKMDEYRKNGEVIEPYSITDMGEYLEFLKDKVPMYLDSINPEERCWPFWYDESQLEFHINNLRHIQHHLGEIIERHDIKKEFKYNWK